ncbi:MAG: response regulator [Candidatus Omnitrophica bacterium CG11_big_fil_rev_8_21_14_0_20_63_9]|nr:MAG: response regulator [Candidatus Omnitrophica bacterium CG11_big_fil_rev_8_21_14_0_20_63_9]
MAKIFLLTHDALLASAYTMRLRRAGFEVAHQATAQSGLAKARQWMPDVILLDLHLPGMDGLQVLKLLRDVPWLVKVPVVLLIDRTTTRDILDQCLLWGAGSYLPKDDCSLAALLAHVRHLAPEGASSVSPSAPGAPAGS